MKIKSYFQFRTAKSVKISKIVSGNSFAIIIWLITLLTFRGISQVQQNTGLDPSWHWMTLEAGRTRSFGKGDFLWTNGPLYFLDAEQSFWAFGLYFSLIYRILAVTVLFFAFYKHLVTSSYNKYLAAISSYYFVAIAVQNFDSTFLLVLGFLIYGFFPASRPFKDPKVLVGCSVLLSVILFIKINYFVILALIAIKILFEKNISVKKIFTILVSFLTSTLVLALINGFGLYAFLKYLRANFEFTVGYKEMGIENPSQGLEYLLILNVFLVVSYLLLSFKPPIKNLILFVLVSYVMFSHGFIRHDGHSRGTFAFFLLFTIILSLALRKIIGYFSIVVVLIISLFTSGIEISQYLNIKVPNLSVSSFFNDLDKRSLEKFTRQDKARISQIFQLPENIQNTIGNKEVSILPFEQIAAYSYNLNLHQPPVVQFYSAYTPWLDSQNELFFKSNKAPEFILLGAPSAIDGRKYWWDSPKTQLAIFCNYQTALQSGEWLLLVERANPICAKKSNESMTKVSPLIFSSINLDKYIVLGDLYFKNSTLNRITAKIFKPLNFPTVNSNGQNFRIVGKNSNNLLLSVPKEFDYPGVWAIGSSSYPQGTNLKQLDISLIELNE
jgi:hypothetical protein